MFLESDTSVTFVIFDSQNFTQNCQKWQFCHLGYWIVKEIYFSRTDSFGMLRLNDHLTKQLSGCASLQIFLDSMSCFPVSNKWALDGFKSLFVSLVPLWALSDLLVDWDDLLGGSSDIPVGSSDLLGGSLVVLDGWSELLDGSSIYLSHCDLTFLRPLT